MIMRLKSNPERPPKHWWDRNYARQIARGLDDSAARRLTGWIWYHKAKPSTKLRAFDEEEAARLFGRKPKRRSATMARGRRRSRGRAIIITARPRRRHSSYHRSNPARRGPGLAGYIDIGGGTFAHRLSSTARKAGKGGRRRRSVRRFLRGAGRWHRPRVRRWKGRYFHAKRSRFFGRRPVMVNPKRRRRARRIYTGRIRRVRINRRRRSYRMNPGMGVKNTIRRLLNKQWMVTIASLAGGIVLGMGVKTILLNVMPMLKLGNQTKYVGVGNIVVGSIMAGMGRQRMIKEAGVVVAATGLYDLVAVLAPALQLQPLPSWSLVAKIGAPKGAVAGSYPVDHLPISPVAAMNGSYASGAQAGYGESYLAPDMRTQGFLGDDSVYAEVGVI